MFQEPTNPAVDYKAEESLALLRAVDPEKYKADRFHPLKNTAVMESIFVAGDESDLEKFRVLMNVPKEKFDLVVYYSRLRRPVIEARQKDWSERKAKSGEMTEEEKKMGVYWEQIEPQVREAVRVCRQKGYEPDYSGFEDFGQMQIIKLSEASPAKFPSLDFPADLTESLEKLKITLTIAPRWIIMHLDAKLTLDQIKDAWDAIAAALPDRSGLVAE